MVAEETFSTTCLPHEVAWDIQLCVLESQCMTLNADGSILNIIGINILRVQAMFLALALALDCYGLIHRSYQQAGQLSAHSTDNPEPCMKVRLHLVGLTVMWTPSSP